MRLRLTAEGRLRLGTPMIIAEYLCLACRHRWAEEAGPTQCPKCGHLYIRWTNREEVTVGRAIPPHQRDRLIGWTLADTWTCQLAHPQLVPCDIR